MPVRGSGAVARSWALVMASISYIQFILTDVEVSLRGDVATVTCTENVLTGDDRHGPDVFGGAPRPGHQRVREDPGRVAAVGAARRTGVLRGGGRRR